jgi:CheY-like chemotaxis protein
MSPEYLSAVSQSAGVPIPVAFPAPRPLIVLHVDDNADDHLLFQTASEQAGLPMVWLAAETVEQAIGYLRNLIEPTCSRRMTWPDLVILDASLPGGSGLNVLEFIRTTPEMSRLPVVVLTGNSNPALADKSRQLGAKGHFFKPSGFEPMLSLVRSLYIIGQEAGPWHPQAGVRPERPRLGFSQ